MISCFAMPCPAESSCVQPFPLKDALTFVCVSSESKESNFLGTRVDGTKMVPSAVTMPVYQEATGIPLSRPSHDRDKLRCRNRSKNAPQYSALRMNVLLAFSLVAIVSSFHTNPPCWPTTDVHTGTDRRRRTAWTRPVLDSRKRSGVSLRCNCREPWRAVNSTAGGPHNYTIYGRVFDPADKLTEAADTRIISNRKSPGIHGFVNGWDAKWINASSFNVHNLLPPDWVEIENYWDRLMPTVSYLGTEKVSKIYKALCVAYSAHRGQMRKSGEPFIVHVRPVSCPNYSITSFVESRWKYRCFWQV